jgi:uncharacterized membrane protein
MRSILQGLWRTGIVGNLLTGSFVLLPLVLTLLIIGWMVGAIATMLGPGSWFGELLTSGGEVIVGQKRELIAFVIGAAIALTGIWMVGLLVRSQARRALDETFDGVLARVPLFRAIYRPVSQVVRLFAGSNADLATMSVVMCRFGGKAGADVPALLASREVYEVAGDRRLLVYLPTSPLPAWGGLVLVPEAAVIPFPSMDADGLIKLYLSFGVLASEVMAPAPRA